MSGPAQVAYTGPGRCSGFPAATAGADPGYRRRGRRNRPQAAGPGLQTVEIVIPLRPFWPGATRENCAGCDGPLKWCFRISLAPDASFDICLFSESFQYIPMADNLPKCLALLAPWQGGSLIADCFRSEPFRRERDRLYKVPVTGRRGKRSPGSCDTIDALGLTVERERGHHLRPSPPRSTWNRGCSTWSGHGLTRVDRELQGPRSPRD